MAAKLAQRVIDLMEAMAYSRAAEFISFHAGVEVEHIVLSAWVDVGPPKSKSERGAPRYIAHKSTGRDGRPFISVTVSSFKHGGYVAKWKSWQNGVTPEAAGSNQRFKPVGIGSQSPGAAASGARAMLVKEAGAIRRYEMARQDGRSRYLDRKQVAEYACAVMGLRYCRDGALMYPLYDADLDAHGVKVISCESKLTFGLMSGKFGVVGGFPSSDGHGDIFVAEGLATALSVYAAMDRKCVIVADNAGNFGKVVSALRRKLPAMTIIICADDDRFDKSGNIRDFNPGLEKAYEAALVASDCFVCAPPGDMPPGNTDFNDLHVMRGIDAVRARLCLRLDPVISDFEG